MTYTYPEFKEKLYKVFELNSLSKYLDEEKAKLFYDFADLLLETNKSMNLTAVKDDDGVILKHLADSLIVADHIPNGARVIDVGCGAGFPTFPLAIARPDLKITSLDSTEKKINFVRSTATALGLANITAISGRAEALSRGELRESFDVATARAVAALPVLTELCMPFIKVDGKFAAMKALRADTEIADTEASGLFFTLGGERHPRVTEYTLTDGVGEPLSRAVVEVKKLTKTPPKYPRNYSQIVKQAKKKG
ncbi:MAG: 16S rRNA (guanine(527)-N(7))-methyltransferase RsmG [Clostridia bacterium]|nr:16S rRNA (guanine(527)-N(7))-methyltransferase RsmG [Clostridia bacterium]